MLLAVVGQVGNCVGSVAVVVAAASAAAAAGVRSCKK